MSDAELERTTIKIDISTSTEKFISIGEILLFDGFLKVYMESNDEFEEENTLENIPALSEKCILQIEQIQAIEKYSQQPYRYTEASLVRKLEELGIGRPSTYAPIISTIQKRQYVVKGNKEGFEREYQILTLKKDKITSSIKKEKIGFEKGKLFPTDIGNVVNNFLSIYFQNIMNYNFTAAVEKEFDDIAQGKIEWKKMIQDFYKIFHSQIETTMDKSEKASGERLIGEDPISGKNVFAKLARFGPVIQIGNSNSKDELKFAKLLQNQSIETITLKEALDLFKLPRTVGSYNNEELVVNVGKFGPYVRYQSKFYSIPKTENLLEISVERCLEIINAKSASDKAKAPTIIGTYNNSEISAAIGKYGPYLLFNKHFYKIPSEFDIPSITLDIAIKIITDAENKNTLKHFNENPNLRILKGKTGPYLSDGKNNYRLPKDKNFDEFSYEDCMQIINENPSKKTKK
jgi:DNA topoisomerase I